MICARQPVQSITCNQNIKEGKFNLICIVKLLNSYFNLFNFSQFSSLWSIYKNIVLLNETYHCNLWMLKVSTMHYMI